MNDIQELKKYIKMFCDKEYSCWESTENAPSETNFTLFAKDCGGYDITNEVTFRLEGDDLRIEFKLEDGTSKKFDLTFSK